VNLLSSVKLTGVVAKAHRAGRSVDPSSRPTRVFILGAGASACCGVPLTNGLLSEVLPLIDDTRAHDRLLQFIKYQYPYFTEKWRNYPRLEEFLSLLDVYLLFSNKVKSKHAFDDDAVENLRRELLRAVSIYLCQKAQAINIKRTRLFHLANRLAPGDVVITFNWDFLLELALFESHRDYSYVHDQDKVSILKLHGSVDWFDSDNISLRADRRFDLIGGIGRINVYKYFKFPNVEKRIVPVIIPPVANKQFEHDEFDRLFKDAWAAMRWADEVHILGFSLPPEDLHVRFLIRSSIRMNEASRPEALHVTVVNPDRDVLLRFARLVHSPIKFLEARLEHVSLSELLGDAPVVQASLVKNNTARIGDRR
jgi:hypothetical protein